MNNTNRLILVDALRGFALLLIVLIHYVEHFDFFLKPNFNFLFSVATDKSVMKWTFAAISGKAYSIFALLFGFSFFIQLNRKEQQGVDFRGRFIWRLIILFIIGMMHSFLYRGDILHMYAALGLILVALYKVNTKALWWIAGLCIIQLPMIYELMQSLIDPDFKLAHSIGKGYGKEARETYQNGSLWEVISFNAWKGRMVVIGWCIYNGRLSQLVGLFVIGLILGRKKIFETLENRQKQLVIFFLVCLSCTIIFYWVQPDIKNLFQSKVSSKILKSMIISYKNIAVTSSAISLIALIYFQFRNGAVFRWFAVYGQMSLTNYLTQSLFGLVLFYGFGFGLYRYFGSAWSILIGFVFFCLQTAVCSYWLKRYHYGPVEWLWRALTYWDFGVRFRRLLLIGQLRSLL